MRSVWLDTPQELLDERRRLGQDGRDEMWDGVLHVVPPPGGPHQRLSTDVVIAVGQRAKSIGLVPHMEAGLYSSDGDYRVPDQLYARPDQVSERGAERAELVVEIRSPDDDTYRKLDFYARLDVREVLVLHPADRRAELFRLTDDRLVPVAPSPEGVLTSDVLGITLQTVDGVLRISWDGGSADV